MVSVSSINLALAASLLAATAIPCDSFSPSSSFASTRRVDTPRRRLGRLANSDGSTLYDDVPKNKPWTFGILTSGFPPQQLLVPFVKFLTFNVWRLMMNEVSVLFSVS